MRIFCCFNYTGISIVLLGATKEEVKQEYAKIALTIHPDQKTSTPGTTEVSNRFMKTDLKMLIVVVCSVTEHEPR